MNRMKIAKIGTIIIVILTVIIAIVFNRDKPKIEVVGYDPEDSIFEEIIIGELPKNSEMLQLSESSLEKYKKLKLKNKDEKVILPYRSKKGDKSINLLVMSKIENSWVEDTTIKLLGESIDNLYIEDLNEDGNPEVIVGINLKNNETKGLTVYGFKKESIQEIFTDSYDKLFVENMNSDDRKEIILSKSKGQDDSDVLITYYSLGEKNKILTDVYSINNYVDMRIGMTKSNKKYILLEYTTNDKEKKITLLRIEKNKFIEVNDMKVEYIKTYSVKDLETGVNESKVENEYIEIPVEVQRNEAGSIIKWETIDDNYELHFLRLEFMNLDKGFYFEIPEYWNRDSLSIYEKEGQEDLESIYVNDGTVGLCIDSYKNIDTENSLKYLESGIIAKTDNYTFVLNSTETTDEKLKEKNMEYLKQKFKILSENEKTYYKK